LIFFGRRRNVAVDRPKPEARSLTVSANQPSAERSLARSELDRLSTPQLVARLAHDAQTLLKAEIELGKSELRAAVASVEQGIRRATLAVVLGFLAANALVAGAILALAQVLEAWAAAFLVGLILAVGSFAAFRLARSSHRRNRQAERGT
jgi:hypothetical protein